MPGTHPPFERLNSYLSDGSPSPVRRRPVPDRNRHAAPKQPRRLPLKVTQRRAGWDPTGLRWFPTAWAGTMDLWNAGPCRRWGQGHAPDLRR